MTEHLGCQLTEQPCLVILGQFLNSSVGPTSRPGCRYTHLEHSEYAFAPGIPDRAQSISCHSTREQARHICDDEAQSATAHTTEHTPELARRSVRSILGHTLLAHHLLEHITKLRILSLFARVFAGLVIIVGEEVPRP